MKRLAYKTSLLLSSILVLLLMLPAVVLADGKMGDEFTKTVNDYQITLVFSAPANVGSNQIYVRVHDMQNKLVLNGDVAVSVIKSVSEHIETGQHNSAHDDKAQGVYVEHNEMGMTTLSIGHHSEEFTGEIEIVAAGDWVVRLHLTLEGELIEVDFPITIVQPQNGFGILAGFLFVNVVVIAAASVLKPKPVPFTLVKGV